jgi:hypothetical protein
VDRFRGAGELSGFRVGNRVRIDRASVGSFANDTDSVNDKPARVRGGSNKPYVLKHFTTWRASGAVWRSTCPEVGSPVARRVNSGCRRRYVGRMVADISLDTGGKSYEVDPPDRQVVQVADAVSHRHRPDRLDGSGCHANHQRGQ